MWCLHPAQTIPGHRGDDLVVGIDLFHRVYHGQNRNGSVITGAQCRHDIRDYPGRYEWSGGVMHQYVFGPFGQGGKPALHGFGPGPAPRHDGDRVGRGQRLGRLGRRHHDDLGDVGMIAERGDRPIKNRPITQGHQRLRHTSAQALTGTGSNDNGGNVHR